MFSEVPVKRYAPKAVEDMATVPNGGYRGNSSPPTLFMLLVKLGDPSVTTVEQRQAVRRIITDYLNNDISHGKVFSYLGQVIGYQALDALIGSMSSSPAIAESNIGESSRHRNNVPQLRLNETDGPEYSKGDNSATAMKLDASVPPGTASPHLPQACPAGDAARRPRNVAFFFRFVLNQLRWMKLALAQELKAASLLQGTPFWGPRVVIFDQKAFFFGGSPSATHSLPEPDSTDDGDEPHTAPVTPTQDPIYMADVWSMGNVERIDTALPLIDSSVDADSTTSSSECYAPSSFVDHSVHLGSFASGPMVVVYGGRIPAQPSAVEDTVFLNDTFLGLDLVSKQWVVLDEMSPQRPPARYSHASALVPLMAGEANSGVYAEYLIIFGGVGIPNEADGKVSSSCSLSTKSSESPEKVDDEQRESGLVWKRARRSQLQVLGDLWVFSFLTGQWTPVTAKVQPAARFGASFFFVNSSTLFLFGGESRAEALVPPRRCNSEDWAERRRDFHDHCSIASLFGLPDGPPILLSDSWVLTYLGSDVPSDELSMENPQLLLQTLTWHRHGGCGGSPPRAHYGAVALTACFPSCLVSPSESSVSATGGGRARGLRWTTAVEESLEDFRQTGFETQRILFAVSGTTVNPDGGIHETPSILVGLVTQSSLSASETPFSVTWRQLDAASLGVGSAGPAFRARRGLTAAYFETPAQPLPEESRSHSTLRLCTGDAKRSTRLSRSPYGGDQTVSPHDAESSMRMRDATTPHDEPPLAPSGVVLRKTADSMKRTRSGRLVRAIETQQAPCILVTAGVTSTGRSRDDFWVLQLSNLEPRFLVQSVPPTGQECSSSVIPATFSRLGLDSSRFLRGDVEDEDMEFLESTRWAGMAPESRASYLHDRALQRRRAASLKDLHVLQGFWNHPARNFQPALFQHGHNVSSGLLWSLATLIRHPLAPFGYLLENAVAPCVRASNVSVCFEVWRGVDVVSVTDDGIGLGQPQLHRLLKCFGYHQDIADAVHQPGSYGAGFKLAASRLAHNCLIITKTADSYGVGLFSAPLNGLFSSSNFSCPVAFWSASTGLPLVYPLEEAEFGQSVNLILTHSPLGVSHALEYEFGRFRSATGTRLLFFGLRKDLPYPYTSAEGRVSYTSYQLPHLFSTPSSATVCPTWKQTGSDVDDQREPATQNSTEELPRYENRQSTSADNTLSEQKTHALLKPCKDSTSSILLPPPLDGTQATVVNNRVTLPDTFPLYCSSDDAPDYSLASYMYWLHLHCGPNLYLNGVHLTPRYPQQVTAQDSDPSPSEEARPATLWTFLQSQLYYKLELSAIRFSGYEDDTGYGIVGFLNHPFPETTGVEFPSAAGRGAPRPPVCETGVLLYHKGRLINRAILKIPTIPECLEPPQSPDRLPQSGHHALTQLYLTVIINVPTGMVPRATKDDFVASSDQTIHSFYDQVEKLIDAYLKVFRDEAALRALENAYGGAQKARANC